MSSFGEAIFVGHPPKWHPRLFIIILLIIVMALLTVKFS
jgi:hypothetical protein